jgi:hypothetical protein
MVMLKYTLFIYCFIAPKYLKFMFISAYYIKPFLKIVCNSPHKSKALND